MNIPSYASEKNPEIHLTMSRKGPQQLRMRSAAHESWMQMSRRRSHVKCQKKRTGEWQCCDPVANEGVRNSAHEGLGKIG